MLVPQLVNKISKSITVETCFIIYLNYTQRKSIADGGEIEKRPFGNRSSLFIQSLRIYSSVQKEFLPPELKLVAI